MFGSFVQFLPNQQVRLLCSLLRSLPPQEQDFTSFNLLNKVVIHSVGVVDKQDIVLPTVYRRFREYVDPCTDNPDNHGLQPSAEGMKNDDEHLYTPVGFNLAWDMLLLVQESGNR